MSTTARILPHKRKVEEAFAGYLIDAQAADSTVLPGLTVVCGHTGRSPDDPENALVDPVEPPLPFLAVSCGKLQADPEMPNSTGIKLCDLIFHLKTQATDEARAVADERLAELEYLLEDEDGIRTALNLPTAVGAADDRRVKGLYFYGFQTDDQADQHDQTTWVDQIAYVVVSQGFDPDDAVAY